MCVAEPLCQLCSRPAVQLNALAALSGLCKAVVGGREAAAAEGAAGLAVQLLRSADAPPSARVNAAELATALVCGGGLALDAALVEELPAAALSVLHSSSTSAELAEAAADVLASLAAEPGAAEALVLASLPAAASGLLTHQNGEVRIRMLLLMSMLLPAPGALAQLLQTDGSLRGVAACAAAHPPGCDEAAIAGDMLRTFQAKLQQHK